jgi:hypothetical protein
VTVIPRSKRPSKRVLPLLVALAGALGAEVPAAGASPCPTNQIVLTGASVSSSNAALDTTANNAHGSYDLRQGLLTSNVDFSDPGWTGSSVSTDDEYWVIGLPAGTPLDFVAEFLVSVSWGVYPGVPQGSFTCEGSLAAATDSAGFAVPPGGCCHGNFTQPLSISLHRVANERFHIRLHLASQDYRGTVNATGLLKFTGLPPGTAVVSCQGYTSDPTVAVEPPITPPSALGVADIHPNPTSASLALTVRSVASAPVKLEVFDLLGRNLISRELRSITPGSYALRLEEARVLPPGVYTLRIHQAGNSATASFTVVR